MEVAENSPSRQSSIPAPPQQ
uniref:Uncharacterized protein n=1 Tax=Arundo donax TaxID=35708 RepID=A0A0A9BLQ5_ARUDO